MLRKNHRILVTNTEVGDRMTCGDVQLVVMCAFASDQNENKLHKDVCIGYLINLRV